VIAAIADLNGRIGVVLKLIEGDRSVGLDHQLILRTVGCMERLLAWLRSSPTELPSIAA
jgi:hypothetical protein